MAPRKSTKKSSAPKRERASVEEDGYDSSLERAETPRARKAAMLQLRIGRLAHILGIVSGLALAATAVLAYLLENWDYLTDASEYVTVLKWVLPLAAGVLVAAIALAVKWEPYFADRTDPHFILSILALVVPVLFIILIALDEAGKMSLGRPDWLFPASLLGISLTLASLAMTWEGRGRRKIISIVSAAFPPILLTFPMIFRFNPIDLASILPMAYLGSAVAIQLSGSMLHIIASATSVQEREVLKASDGKLREQIRELERRRVALDYREEAFTTKESDLEAYEKRLTEEIDSIDECKKQITVMEAETEQRVQQSRIDRREVAKKEAEIEARAETLRLKQGDIDSQIKEFAKRAKSFAAREEKLSAKEAELDKRVLEMQSKEREVKDGIVDLADEKSSLELRRKELDALQETLAEKEKQLAMRETTADLRTMETVAVKEEIGKFTEEKGAIERLEQQLLMKQESISEREIALRAQEEEFRKKAQKAERIIARADKQMNELIEKEAELLERRKQFAQEEADHRSALYSLEAQQEEIRLSKEESADIEKKHTDMSEELRKRLDEVSAMKEDFGNRLLSLERRERTIKDLETRLKTEHEHFNAKARDLIAKDKSLKTKETELGLKHAEIKSMERKLLRSVDDFEDARSELPRDDSEKQKTIEVRERRLDEKEREMKSRFYQREKELERREHALQSQLRKDIEGMEEAVETEYVEKKVKTGIERLDDLLMGGMPFASNVLYVGPPFIGKETAMFLFLADGLKKGVPVVIVTTSHPPEEVARQMAPIMPTFMEFSQLGLVRWIDASGSGQPGDEGAASNEMRVAGPDDYSGILKALEKTMESLSKEGNPYVRVAYLSLSMSIPKAEDKGAYKFIQKFVGMIRQANAIGVYALEKGMHTDQQLESIQHQMTGAVQFKSEKQKTLLSVQGIGEAQTRDWIEYRHTNKAIMVGAFSLERIR
jgi:KaiC/GvpD/RAD55 family RecA-like ATPase